MQRTLVGRYWHDAFIQMDDFKNEGVVASGSWPFQVNVLKADGAPVASVFPKEGITGWADTTMLHADSAHPNCAYMWMEHSLSPKVQGDVSAWFGTVPSVPAACKGNELLTDEGCATNGYDNFDKIRFWRTPTAKCEHGRMRALLPLGLRLCRRDRRPLIRAQSGRGALSASRTSFPDGEPQCGSWSLPRGRCRRMPRLDRAARAMPAMDQETARQ